MFGLLRFLRGVIGVLFALQVLGLLPALTWLQDPGAVDGKMLAFLVMKIVLALAFGALFFGMRTLINKLYTKRHGGPHPALGKRFAL